MTRERLDLGKFGEKLAMKKIKRLGYRCIERNYRCPLGEVDIIARDGDCLVFVEVRTKTNKDFGRPEESITEAKKRRLVATALNYL